MGCGLISSSLITPVPCVLYTSYQREVLRSKLEKGSIVFGVFMQNSSQAELWERKNKGQQIDGGTVVVPNSAVVWVQT